jgi:hypothetical protein
MRILQSGQRISRFIHIPVNPIHSASSGWHPNYGLYKCSFKCIMCINYTLPTYLPKVICLLPTYNCGPLNWDYSIYIVPE